jgi:uncharacterized protein (TIGR00369 family)
MGLADNVGGFCAFLNLPDAAGGTATIESKTNFFAAVREGHVHAVSRPLHTGRRTIVVDTELYDDAGKLVARRPCSRRIRTFRRWAGLRPALSRAR